MIPAAPTMSSGVAGVCVIRNAADLVPFLCGHYLRAGFAHLAFVDDGSTDGTFEALTRVARRTPRVSVRQVQRPTFDQPELINEAANALIAAGHSIVVPFDADEFWNVTAHEFERLSAACAETSFRGAWVNFVQARTQLRSNRRGLFGIRFRAPATENASRERTRDYVDSFVCYSECKIALKTRGKVVIAHGQHAITVGPVSVCGPMLEVFHLPLRSREEIIRRGNDYEPRRAPTRVDPTNSWQSAFHRDVVLSGKVDAVWAANSADASGMLDVYGRPVRLAPDNRLRVLLARAALHLWLKYRLSPFGTA